MQKIRKNDTVVVLAGKCKGLEGKVLRVYPRFGKVLVDGVNLVKKHVKPNPDKNEKGGIVEKELPIHLSNVGLKLPFKVDNSGDKIKNSCYLLRVCFTSPF